MTPKDAITHFGTQVKLAQAIGLTQGSVAGWVRVGRIPVGRQFQLAAITGGALLVDPGLLPGEPGLDPTHQAA